MPSIFISYRREDAAGHAGRLCDRLNARLGSDRVFMDVEDVRPGQDFVRAIDDTVSTCDYLLVLIGPRWLETMKSRAMAEADFVRHEILSALRAGVTVVPVLVAGAAMPEARQLPSDLAELSRRHAVEIRDDRFDHDVRQLIDVLGGAAPGRWGPALTSTGRTWGVAAAAVVALALLLSAFLALRPETPALDGEWTAEMQNERKQTFTIGLTLMRAGDAFTGMVRYPTGDGAVLDATMDGDTITFHTSHVPQFESEPAVIRVVGTIEADGIQLIVTSDSGVATGIARRVEPQ